MNPPTYYERNRYYALRRICRVRDIPFDIDMKDYAKVVRKPEECEICGSSQCHTKKSLSVDHCHTTGKVRGKLCASCNHKLARVEKGSPVTWPSEKLSLSANVYLRTYSHV